MGVLSVCGRMYLCVIYTSTFLSLSGSGQKRLSRNLKDFNFIVTFLGPLEIYSLAIFMSGVWVHGIRKYSSLYKYICSQSA